MLLKFGTDEIRKNFLEPMVAGKAISSYGMTEPGHGGSFPSLITTMRTSVKRELDDQRQKMVCRQRGPGHFCYRPGAYRQGRCSALGKALSMILVPTDSPGFKVERQINMLGRSLGQGEISFTEVQRPRVQSFRLTAAAGWI